MGLDPLESLSPYFHAYVEHPKWTLYATSVSFLVRAAPRLRGELELELFWASTLGTRTR